MKIVVLDGYALNPGDLDWDKLQALGQLTVYDRTSADQIVERAKGAHVILTNKTPLTEEVLAKLPDLQYIGVLATGYNIVDVSYANHRGIVVTNVPAYSTFSVAQFTFALLLELCHRVQWHSDAVYAGEWTSNPDFSFTKYPQMELMDKTIGIIGFGSIGSQVARIAEVFGMHVLTVERGKRYPHSDLHYVEWPELLAQSDVISLHCPLTPDTEGLINKDTLAQMREEALLINTSRGGLIVEQDLAHALEEGWIAGAAVDVLTSEPPSAEHPLLRAKNCIIAPHIAWATKEARTRLMDTAVQNVRSFLEGKPLNALNSKL